MPSENHKRNPKARPQRPEPTPLADTCRPNGRRPIPDPARRLADAAAGRYRPSLSGSWRTSIPPHAAHAAARYRDAWNARLAIAEHVLDPVDA